MESANNVEDTSSRSGEQIYDGGVIVGVGAALDGSRRTNASRVYGLCELGCMPDRPNNASDGQMAAQFERIIRRVKQSMNYRGSYTTRDILDSLVARWIHSGEWERLKLTAPEDRHIGESVRRFILDRFDQLHRRGRREDLDTMEISLPDDATLTEIVERAELRRWIADRVAELEAGTVDARVAIPLGQPLQVGRVLRKHLDGKTQREIAAAFGMSLGAVNKRIADGTNYLILLQGIEQGIGSGDGGR